MQSGCEFGRSNAAAGPTYRGSGVPSESAGDLSTATADAMTMMLNTTIKTINMMVQWPLQMTAISLNWMMWGMQSMSRGLSACAASK
jgi:hypothetical protein